jgi:hypothetical protein
MTWRPTHENSLGTTKTARVVNECNRLEESMTVLIQTIRRDDTPPHRHDQLMSELLDQHETFAKYYATLLQQSELTLVAIPDEGFAQPPPGVRVGSGRGPIGLTGTINPGFAHIELVLSAPHEYFTGPAKLNPKSSWGRV